MWMGRTSLKEYKVVMDNLDFRFITQMIENVFQNPVQEKWHHFFVIEFNLLYIHTELCDEGTGTSLSQGTARLWFSVLNEGQGGWAEEWWIGNDHKLSQ